MANTAPTIFSAADGKVVTRIGAYSTSGSSVALQADGRFVVAGVIDDGELKKFALVRYNADGSLDTTFGTNGSVVTSQGIGDRAVSVEIQSNGKILVSGETDSASRGVNFGLARYNANGTLDTTFSGDGLVSTDFGFAAANDYAKGMTLQSDGKFIVVGVSTIGGDNDFTIARYNNDGSLDRAFSGDGKTSFNFSGGETNNDEARAVAVQADGRIIVAGAATVSGTFTDFAIVRFNADGSTDTTFNSGGTPGKLVRSFGGTDTPESVVLQADGKILVAGTTNAFGTNDFALMRLNSDGTTDSTFGTGGGQATTNLGGSEEAHSILVQKDGKIIVGGFTDSGGNVFDFVLVRYSANGTLDTGFGTGGKVLTNFGVTASTDRGFDISLQADGKIIVSGSTIFDSSNQIAVARYNTNGTLDTTFGRTNFTEGGKAVVIDSGLTVHDANLGTGAYSGTSMTLSRSGGAKAEDVFSGSLFSLVQGKDIVVNGTTIGEVTKNSGGILQLSFDAFPERRLVELALQQMTYKNTSEKPPSKVTLEWTFSDGDPGGTLSETTTTAVYIKGINDAPVMTSNGGGTTASISINENKTAVTTVHATDVDSAAPTYSIVGGADKAAFKIDAATGALAFKSAPDFEAKADVDHNNVYVVQVRATDGSLTDTQTINVTVKNVAGNTIVGTLNNDKIDGTHGISGKFSTGEEDTISGGAGNDTINSGNGNDKLIGGTGKDLLTGGAGSDQFIFAKGDSGIKTSDTDTITDWTTADAIDTAIAGTSGNYYEHSVASTVDTIEEAAAYAKAQVTNKAIAHVFLYNSSKDIGFLLMDLDNNDTFETGVILSKSGAAGDFSYADLI